MRVSWEGGCGNTEGRGPLETCMTVGDAPTGSNMHSKRIENYMNGFEGTDGCREVRGGETVPKSGANFVSQRVVFV